MKLIKVLKQWYFKFKYHELLGYYELSYLGSLRKELDDIERTYVTEGVGLCGQIGLDWRISKLLGSSWQYYSGDPVYPIGGKISYHNNLTSGHLWVGFQKELRLSYAKHLSTEISKILKGIGYET